MNILSSPDCPSVVALFILRALNTIADAIPLERPISYPQDNQLTNLLYSSEHVRSLARILRQSSSSSSVQQSITLAAGLICKTCREESHKAAIAASGGLDALAMRLASFVVSQGFVLPGAESHMHEAGSMGTLPPSAPARAQLSPILRATAIIIERSESRALQLLSSPAIITVFPKPQPEFSPSDIRKGPWGSYLSGHAVPRKVIANMIDLAVLPSILVPQYKVSTRSSNFPPLPDAANGSEKFPGLTRSTEGPSTFFDSIQADSNVDGDESALISWLIHLVRADSGMTRLMAARLVVSFFRLGLAKKHRVPMFGLLLVPLLARMLDKDNVLTDDQEFDELVYPSTLCLKEEAPSILAALVMDDESLQKAAVDADAIKKLSQLLKNAYEPIIDTSQIKSWRPDGGEVSPTRDSRNPPSMRLGKPSQPFLAGHKMRLREGVLKALAALSPSKDDYRKKICEQGVVPYIIDSLKPTVNFPTNYEQPPKTPMYMTGNPTPTLLAACEAARALTRSVSILRTSLIDAGVAPPLFALLKYPDVDVQIAATAVICNLALDFSPMKEVSCTIPLEVPLNNPTQAIVQAGVLTILYEHAHSTNKKLRLDTLWALKHLVYNANNDLKMDVVAKLGATWLTQIITNEVDISRRTTDDSDMKEPISMGTPNSMGEQVDILNPVDDLKDLTSQDDGSDDLKMTESTGSLNQNGSESSQLNRRRSTLTSTGWENLSRQAQTENYAVQEQAMDLLRNLTCGSGAPEMVDFLFSELGEEKLLGMLSDKLHPAAVALRSESKSFASRTAVAEKTTYVLIHIAASRPGHRQLLVRQTELMRGLLPLFKHANSTMRINAVWVVINLTWVDDVSDRVGCRSRAAELQKMGFYEALGGLQDDGELDVRERVKTAMHQMRELLRELPRE
jgi:armadillo repeat-containing protein 8